MAHQDISGNSHQSSPSTDPPIEQRLQQAVQQLQSGRIHEAITLYEQILQQQPDQPVALHVLGLLNYQTGNTESAIKLIEKAISNKPDFAAACNTLGNIYRDLGQLDNAVEKYRQAIDIEPELVEAHFNLAIIYQQQHRLDDAKKCYQETLVIKPDLVEARRSLGEVLHLCAQTEAAHQQEIDSSSETAVQRQQQRAIQFYNQGVLCENQGNQDEAMTNYQQAVAIKPDFAEAYNNLGNILMIKGQLTDALVCFQNTLSLNSNSIHAYNNIGNALTNMGRLVEASTSIQEALRLDPRSATAHSNLLSTLCYRPDYDVSMLFAEYLRWGEMHGRNPAGLAGHNNVPDETRRLRLGYVSADFRNHPVGYFIEQVLASHDSTQFEIYCYSNQVNDDDMTARLRRHADHWRDIVGQPDDAVIRQIRKDAIDILVDLAGHTARNNLTVFAQKPAPVQATWIGDPATTGLPAMDYIIGDRYAIPRGDERYYVERIVRLPHAYECFSPPDYPIEPGPVPAFANGKITFGCFNNTCKVTEAVVACWSAILRALPDAELHLKYKPYGDTGVRRRYLGLFSTQGIETKRIRLSGQSPRDEFLAEYQNVDIGLDPFPYNGGLTTLEALWMGVPVISLRGDRFVGRMGETLLTNVGLEECVADSKEEYITKALDLATDLPRLANLRSGLRKQLLDSPVCDGTGFTHDLESAYRTMWQTWCHTQTQSRA